MPDSQKETGALCMQCGYPLRGLPRRGDCPECGKSVAASIEDWASGGRRDRAFVRAGNWIVRVCGTVFAISIVASLIFQTFVFNCGDVLLVALGTAMRTHRSRPAANFSLFFLGLVTVGALSVGIAAALRLPSLQFAGRPLPASQASLVAFIAFGMACIYGWLFRLTWMAIREDRAMRDRR